MSITVEDGTGTNPQANSYDSLANIQTYALDRGVTLDSVEARVIRAMDWLEVQNWIGCALSETQPLSWPRTVQGVPTKVKQALASLVMADFAGVTLLGNAPSERLVKSEQVGELKVEYTTGELAQPRLEAVAILRGLIFPTMKSTRA